MKDVKAGLSVVIKKKHKRTRAKWDYYYGIVGTVTLRACTNHDTPWWLWLWGVAVFPLVDSQRPHHEKLQFRFHKKAKPTCPLQPGELALSVT